MLSGDIPDMKGFLPSSEAHVPSRNTELPVVDPATNLPLFALDCEMCRTDEGLVLARVSLVNEDGKVVLDELVQPPGPVTDYLTRWSGITPDMLQGVTTTLADVQARVRALLPGDAVLVGHSLENDLKALKLVHPRVIDTALLYPHAAGDTHKYGLKALAERYLGRLIQVQGDGHDSVEDAMACLDLVRLKLQRGIPPRVPRCSPPVATHSPPDSSPQAPASARRPTPPRAYSGACCAPTKRYARVFPMQAVVVCSRRCAHRADSLTEPRCLLTTARRSACRGRQTIRPRTRRGKWPYATWTLWWCTCTAWPWLAMTSAPKPRAAWTSM